MSAEISRHRRPSGFALYEWLMLIVAVTTATVMFVLLRDPVLKTGTLAQNIYDDPCSNIFVENASCTKFLIRGSLSPDSSAQVKPLNTAPNGD
jgi:hypothetical protein